MSRMTDGAAKIKSLDPEVEAYIKRMNKHHGAPVSVHGHFADLFSEARIEKMRADRKIVMPKYREGLPYIPGITVSPNALEIKCNVLRHPALLPSDSEEEGTAISGVKYFDRYGPTFSTLSLPDRMRHTCLTRSRAMMNFVKQFISKHPEINTIIIDNDLNEWSLTLERNEFLTIALGSLEEILKENTAISKVLYINTGYSVEEIKYFPTASDSDLELLVARVARLTTKNQLAVQVDLIKIVDSVFELNLNSMFLDARLLETFFDALGDRTKNVKRLFFKESNLDDASIIFLVGLILGGRFPLLSYLDLSWNRITKTGLDYIRLLFSSTSTAPLPLISSIDFSNNYVQLEEEGSRQLLGFIEEKNITIKLSANYLASRAVNILRESEFVFFDLLAKHKSIINCEIDLEKEKWIVYLMAKKEGPMNDHALIIVEGINSDDQLFIFRSELFSNPDGTASIEVGYISPEKAKKVLNRYGYVSYEKTHIDGQVLIGDIEDDKRMGNFIRYSKLGIKSGRTHNCITWAADKLVKIGITVDFGFLGKTFAIPSLVVKSSTEAGRCSVM